MDDENDPNATYYFLTTKEPNNMAIDSMFNRAFGKPTESHELTGKDGQPLMPAVIKVVELPTTPKDAA
jgi:hypothetical protein